MAKNLVVKDNALINASYNLELVEQRLILLAILEARQINQEITSKTFLTIHADRYINEFGVHRNVAYQALKDACSHLFERRFTYQKLTERGNVEHVTSRWVQSISYVENEAVIRLKFSDDVTPLITNLERHFTSYELEQVAELNSKYAVRLYEVIIAWRSTGKTPMLTVEELRNRLGVLDDEYLKMELFKRKVLDLSVNKINEKTEISISYEQHKRGRNIVGFTFTIQQKEKADTLPEPQIDSKTVDLFKDLNDLERQAVQNRVDEYIKQMEDKGETVTSLYRANITKMAVREQWGIDELQAELDRQQQAAKRKEMEQRWQDTPNGTRFRHTQNGSLWFKESGLLRTEDNRFAAESQITDIFQYLEQISE